MLAACVAYAIVFILWFSSSWKFEEVFSKSLPNLSKVNRVSHRAWQRLAASHEICSKQDRHEARRFLE